MALPFLVSPPNEVPDPDGPVPTLGLETLGHIFLMGLVLRARKGLSEFWLFEEKFLREALSAELELDERYYGILRRNIWLRFIRKHV